MQVCPYGVLERPVVCVSRAFPAAVGEIVGQMRERDHVLGAAIE